MERLERFCAVCGEKIAVPVGVALMTATNLAQARAHGACGYCAACDSSYCFDHVVWRPARISSTQTTTVAVCPKCGETMGGLPA